MRRSAVVIVLVLALLGGSRAQGSGRSHIDASAISDALQDFLTEMRQQLQEDAATWRTRAQKARQDFRERFNIGTDDETARKRSLLTTTTDTVVDNKLDKLQAGWQLLRDAGGAVWDVVDTKVLKIKDFFHDMFGADYAQYLPQNWLTDSMTWDRLGDFDINSNMVDFLSNNEIQEITRPQSLEELYGTMDSAKDHFCKEDKYDHPDKIPTRCLGPAIRLALEPKTCVFISKEKQIICDPAKLVLEKIPGSCELKHYTPALWKGKECKLTIKAGFAKEFNITGNTFPVSLGHIDDHNLDFSNLFNHRGEEPTPP